MISKLLPLTFLSIGVILLMQVISPVLAFKVWEIGQSYTNSWISPKPDQQILGISIKNQGNFPGFYSLLKRETIPSYSNFSLSVPSINVSSLVWVDSNDLSQGLVHLPGSALPGERGNIFISGHSAINFILGQDKAIFARLMDIKKGNKILVEANGEKFTYLVIDIKAVDPNNLSVIFPPERTGRYISLMTCVPPGLNTKRLIVLGKMI